MELKPHEKIKIARQRKELTQLCFGLKVDLSQMQVSRLERGAYIPKDHEKKLIEKVLCETIWSDDK